MTHGSEQKQQLLSLVIPCYNEEEVISETLKRLKEFCAGLQDLDVELIFIDDGSRDKTRILLKGYAAEDSRIKVICFARNFGHQIAVTAGIDAARGDAVVLIDADLQDPPEVIHQMIAKWREGYDVVYGTRTERPGESAFKLATARSFYRLLNKLSDVPIPLDTGDFRLIGRNVADLFLQMREHNRFLRGMSAWMGFNAVPIAYERQERFAGQTKYTLKKMLRLASDGITGFSDKPLTLPMQFGIGLCVLAGLGLLALIVVAIVSSVSGWLWAADAILMIQGLTLFFMGLQGMYLGRMYDELKGRPLYIVAEKHNLD